MQINNQRGVITGMSAGAAAGESQRTDETVPKSGGAYTGPVMLADKQGGTISSNTTFQPDVTPAAGWQCFTYTISSTCTLGALTGTASMANDTAVGGAIYLHFTGTYTVTINSAYKLPAGMSNSISGVNGDVWRLEFRYRKTSGRCSASLLKEAA